jgi:ribokinase
MRRVASRQVARVAPRCIASRASAWALRRREIFTIQLFAAFKFTWCCMAERKRIVVIGSVNMDLVARAARIPAPGETVLGNDFVTVAGGKGANQAVAAARLSTDGTNVHLIARVGDDDFGTRLLTGLHQHRINTQHVTITEGTPTGVAMILVDRRGENAIVVAPGANAKLSPADIDAAERLIATASVVVMQLEAPVATIVHAIATCQRLGVFTILDPAPVPPRGLARPLYGVDVLTPNQGEAERLVGADPDAHVRNRRPEDAKQIGSKLLSRGARRVVLKLGSKGAMLLDRDGTIRTARTFKVKVVDTTAAGDAFTAGLAVAHVERMDAAAALEFATAAGAACCQAFGAQPALPDRQAVEALIASRTSR